MHVVHDSNNFRFPTMDDRAQEWKLKLGITTNKNVTGFVCIHHFSERELSHGSSGKIALKAGAVPSLNLGCVDYIDSIHSAANVLPALPASSSSSSSSAVSAFLTAPIHCDKCTPDLLEKEEEISRLKNEYTKIKQELSLHREKSERKIKALQKKVKRLQNHTQYLDKINARVKNDKKNKILLEVCIVVCIECLIFVVRKISN